MLSSPIHLDHHHSTVEPLLLRCRTDIATLSLCCRSAVAPLLHRYCSAVATPLSLRCCAAVTPLFHRYRSTVAPLLSLLLSIRSHTAITPVSLHCHSATIAPLLRCCHTAIASVLLHCRSAHVAPAVATQSHRYRTGISPLLLRCCRSFCCYAVHRYQTVVAPLSNRDRSSPERV